MADGSGSYSPYNFPLSEFGILNFPSVPSNDISNMSFGSTAASGRSDVWEYFDELTRNNVSYAAKCKICRKDYTVRPGGGTGHLKRHALSCKKKQGIHMMQQQL